MLTFLVGENSIQVDVLTKTVIGSELPYETLMPILIEQINETTMELWDMAALLGTELEQKIDDYVKVARYFLPEHTTHAYEWFRTEMSASALWRPADFLLTNERLPDAFNSDTDYTFIIPEKKYERFNQTLREAYAALHGEEICGDERILQDIPGTPCRQDSGNLQ